MKGDQIVERWKPFVELASIRSVRRAVSARRNVSSPEIHSGGDRFDETKMTPYFPDSHSERCNSSLNIGC
jgi:hypothetical protein